MTNTAAIAAGAIRPRPYDGSTPLQQEKRTKILNVVRGLMAAGTFQPRVEQIAGAAGVTCRTFYNHFESAPHAWEQALDGPTTGAILSKIMPNGPWPASDDCSRVVRAAVFGRLST